MPALKCLYTWRANRHNESDGGALHEQKIEENWSHFVICEGLFIVVFKEFNFDPF